MMVSILIVLVLMVVAIILFATEKLPVDLVAMVIMATLLVSGVISLSDGVSGFSNPATMTVAAMFVLSAGLNRTGAVNFVGRGMARLCRGHFWASLITIMVSIGVVSAFINNTAAVAIFLPIVLGLARDMKVSPSRLLMPLSFASMFGGVCTLIGTSTNILVNSIAIQHGQPPFRMFEFASLGVVMFVAGGAYMVLVGVRLVPARRSVGDLTESFGMGDYITEIILRPDAASVGKPLRNSPLVEALDVDVLRIFRDGRRLPSVTPDTVIEANDMLRVRCDVTKIRAMQDRVGVELKSRGQWHDADLEVGRDVLVEAVVAPNSPLEGKSLKELQFRSLYGGTALALRHSGRVLHERLGRTPLRAGDVLLIEVKPENLQTLKRNPAFILVSEVDLPDYRKGRILPAVLIIGGVVATAALGIAPILLSALVGAVLMVLCGCLTMEDAYESIQWKIIFLLAGVITLGIALERSGAAALLSAGMIRTVGVWGPAATVSAFYLLTSLLTEIMSNNAAAVLLAPIAIATADSLGVDARPLLMAVTFAASASFMTPVGYQTNTLIYGPGQYKFSDFMRVGAPLNLLFWLLATVLIPRIWGF